MGKLPSKLKTYLVTVYVLTAAVLFFSVYNLGMKDFNAFNTLKPVNLFFLILLTALTESFVVSFSKVAISTTFAVSIAVYLLFGIIPLIIVTIFGILLSVLKTDNGYKHILNTPWYGTLFNLCVLIFPALIGHMIYVKIGGSFKFLEIYNNIFPLFLFSFIFFVLNILLMAILFSIQTGKNILYALAENTRAIGIGHFLLVPIGIILAYLLQKLGVGGAILAIFPILLARFTISLYVDTKKQYIQTVDTIMLAMEARDQYTDGHSKRVSELAVKIAKKLNYNDMHIDQLKIASLLHDVGKIGVRDNILNKPGKLTDEEYENIKQHPEKGYNILKSVKSLERILPIIKHHHERYDGKGYPDGKNAEELSLDVFIVQLADSVDAMATDRPYRKALSKDVIREELTKYSGSQFHPKVVETYLKILDAEVAEE